jgi:hypothetical protein
MLGVVVPVPPDATAIGVVEVTDVKAPVDGVVAPIDILLIVPKLVGATSRLPVPVGFMCT